LEAAFVLLEFSSPSRRIFIGSHSLPPSLVRRIGPSQGRGENKVVQLVNTAANDAANAPANPTANAPANAPANATGNVINNVDNAANV
jgi:hypothetical protein